MWVAPALLIPCFSQRNIEARFKEIADNFKYPEDFPEDQKGQSKSVYTEVRDDEPDISEFVEKVFTEQLEFIQATKDEEEVEDKNLE